MLFNQGKLKRNKNLSLENQRLLFSQIYVSRCQRRIQDTVWVSECYDYVPVIWTMRIKF